MAIVSRKEKDLIEHHLDNLAEGLDALLGPPIRAVAARLKERKELKDLERKVKKKQLENRLRELDK